MARISLDTVWLTAQDKSGAWTDTIELVSASDLQQTESSNLRVRNATGDRSLATILPGATQTWRVDCKLAVSYEVEWLRDHRGQLVCVRDMLGRRIFGVYSEVSGTPYVTQTHYQTSITVTQVDYGEAS